MAHAHTSALSSAIDDVEYRLRNASDGADESCELFESSRMCLPPRPYLKFGGLHFDHTASNDSNVLPSRW